MAHRCRSRSNLMSFKLLLLRGQISLDSMPPESVHTVGLRPDPVLIMNWQRHPSIQQHASVSFGSPPVDRARQIDLVAPRLILSSGETDDCIELPLSPYPRQHGVEPFFETGPPVSGDRN
jgi:hypothetical protein